MESESKSWDGVGVGREVGLRVWWDEVGAVQSGGFLGVGVGLSIGQKSEMDSEEDIFMDASMTDSEQVKDQGLTGYYLRGTLMIK